MSIMEYNGSGIVAMAGKNCVAVASDMRFGIQQQTLADNMHKIFRMNEKTYIGMSGLVSDMQTLEQKLNFRLKMYELREDRQIKTSVFSNLVSTMLYEKRFGPWFVEPVVCGLEDKDGKKNVPYLCAMDLIALLCTRMTSWWRAHAQSSSMVYARLCTNQIWSPRISLKLFLNACSRLWIGTAWQVGEPSFTSSHRRAPLHASSSPGRIK